MTTLTNSLPLLQAGAGGPATMAPTLVTFGLVFLIFYFLIIRPQNKRQKETKAMLARLQKGDRVVTIGGIRGVIQSLKDETVVVKVDTDTKLELSRSAISSVLAKGKGGGGGGGKKGQSSKAAAEVQFDDDSESEENESFADAERANE